MPDTPDAPDVVAALQGANAQLREQNAELRAENAELKAQLAEQTEKIARLERLISRNSGNSSMPLSGDDQPGRTPPQLRPRSGQKRKPGKQPGAPGAHLEWSDHPDKTVPCFRRAAAPAALTWPARGISGRLRMFRHGVNAGLSEVSRVPGSSARQPPARCLLECLKHREADVLRFLTGTAIPGEQPGRTGRPPSKDAAESLRPTPLRADRPPPVRRPRLRIDRHQARTSGLHRHPRRPRREPWIPPVPDLT